MIEFIFICFCIASISYTITATSIFKWFRELVSPFHSKIEDLVHCPYCLGHYVAIFVLLITKYRIECSNIEFVNFMFTWFSVMGCVACMHFIMTRAYEPIARAMTSRKLEQLNK